MAGPHTLGETERQVVDRVGQLPLDYAAMAVVSNLFRASNAVRNHLERTVLSGHNLSWTAFVVLWVTWIWEPIETRNVALESGISKATLTGVLTTLEKRGWVTREKSETDGRLVLVRMTAAGRDLMVALFPNFNLEEQRVVKTIGEDDLAGFADLLRAVTASVEPAASSSEEPPSNPER